VQFDVTALTVIEAADAATRNRGPGAPESGRRERGIRDQGIGRSAAAEGKIVAITDALSCWAQTHDIEGVPELVDGLLSGAESRGAREYDREMYGWRHRIENFSRRPGVPGDRDALRQDGRELRGGDPSRGRRDRGEIIVNRS